MLDIDLGWLIDGSVDAKITRTIFRHKYDSDGVVHILSDAIGCADLELVEPALLLADVTGETIFDVLATV